MYLHAPIITKNDCEGAGEMFQVTTLLLDADEKAKVAPPTAEVVKAAQAAAAAQGEKIRTMKAEKVKAKKLKPEVEKLTELKGALDAIMEKVRLAEGGGIPRTEEGAIDYEKDFFRRKAYLSVSGQLDAESCVPLLS
jgi:asparaginyl-tRNA synthetase